LCNSHTRYEIIISAGGTLAFTGKLRGEVTVLITPLPQQKTGNGTLYTSTWFAFQLKNIRM
jgi:hypothetical protein